MKTLLLLMLAAASGGKEIRRELKSPEQFQGYSCAAGYAWFFTDGRLSSCSVSRETDFGEIRVPEKSWIFLSAKGVPRSVVPAHQSIVKIGKRVPADGHRLSPGEST